MKFVLRRPPPESVENSAGGGLAGFLREAAILLAAHWLIALAIALAFRAAAAMVAGLVWVLVGA